MEWNGMRKGYFAKNAVSSISIFSTDILFLTKLQKRQTPQKGFALIEKTISQNFWADII
jgi:hypothetical protein